MGLELVDDGRCDLSVMEETLPAFEDLLLRQETLRFEAFMRASGWTDLPLDCVHDGIYQDKLKKRHARLSAENTKKLSDITGRNFDVEDRQNLYRIPQILRLAGNCPERNFRYGKRWKPKRRICDSHKTTVKAKNL